MNRKRALQMLLVVFLVLAVPLMATARDMAPIVSVEWLEKNLKNPDVVAIDIRKVEDYKAGHIPGAINVFAGVWAIASKGLKNELPAADDLFDAISSAGIGANSLVVIVGKTDAMPDRADVTRVAWTLKYAGLENIALLDGGYSKWVADKKAVSLEAAKAKEKPFKGKINPDLFASKDYVVSRVGKATIIDARAADFYLGKKKLDFVEKAGHITGSKNLFSGLAYTTDGTFKDKAALSTLAVSTAGENNTKELIIYCDTGRLASVWSYILSDVLGYKNVKLYDGSMEELTKDTKAPLEL